ncbi:MAG: bifunctional UDP-3-O-[3-hydroxymyristoyl] N-acetylglucosamine deacetylase/3-hydroxyacyl-ACP dehydratase [bacterium]
MFEEQQTIAQPATISGVGLHTGNKTTITFHPAPPNAGIFFRRPDLEGAPQIKADIDHVISTARGTTIGKGPVVVHTVEHVMAAIAGLRIDNVVIELDNNEPPVCDGSALPFVQVLKEAGTVKQSSPRDYLVIEKTIAYSDEKNGVDIVVFPSDEFRITFLIDYKTPSVGTQYTAIYSLKEFETEFAPARTFCLLSEVEDLYRQGLIKGGSLDNAVVFTDREVKSQEIDHLSKIFGPHLDLRSIEKNGHLNPGELRYKNEPARHKALDLLGDLALLGVPLKAHVQAARSGHAANVEIVKRIRKEYEKIQITSKYQGRHSGEYVFDAQAIQRILPHRYPFLMVDRILDLTPRERVVGIKNVTFNEPFFQGHFPGHPIMPGVLLIEAMAQTGGILLLNTQDNPEDKLVYFTGVDKVKFRKPVRPGDQVRFEVEMLKLRQSICKMSGKAFVANELVCEAELSAAVVDRT